ncbi:MAG TPA: 23S rRNA (adenine(2503)-C(2))-methyltransferase RlmN [Candidatus Moranbacteria bacterium]|nr:23S rRNA (adenine(2503)-C(2))-methyltransferase RlmN [Candidatus Moranbacteria bacterium]HAT74530.1 23S rRNA (adenine(2503)-C(2))-methyltransferase RlmN [Candidatus Moranbacteria bacterium]
MQIEKLKKILTENNQPKFRLKQIEKAIFRDSVFSFAEISTISKELREILEKEMKILSFEAKKVLLAKDNLSAKVLLKLSDENFIESVLMSSMLNKWSVCVSTQVGCPISCAFCATGKSGFKRNLTSEEISDQVLFWRQYLNKPHPSPLLTKERGQINNVVYMGMGEPFLNWENIAESLKILTDKSLFGFGSRSISVSTVGIPEGIEKLAQEFPQINLAISLHFAADEKRNKFMPVNKKYNLAEINKSLRNYFSKTSRQVFIEYIMLAGINDSEADAYALASYLKSIGNRHLLHINLIKYNESGGRFNASSGNKIQLFKKYLERGGFGVTIRKSIGQEIQGACGQLAGK